MPLAPTPPHPLEDGLLQEVAVLGTRRHFPARTVLINEGDTADSLFLILSGRVKVYATGEEGKDVVITMHGRGEYIGELALDGGVRSASVMTLEPTTCAVVSGADLREIVRTNPAFAQHLIQKLIWRLRQATDSVKGLALQDVYGRVTALLNSLSAEADGVVIVTERLTYQEIAERVGSSREMVGRIFRDLTTGGYISNATGRITIHRRLPSAW